MAWALNLLYLVVLALLSPWLAYRALRTGRYRRGLSAKLLGRQGRHFEPGSVWFHGVSLGEINLLRHVVPAFQRRHPGHPCVISTTTETGFDHARRAFPDLPVFFFPFDFSWAVRRTLREVKPAVVVLSEGEVWPNFLLACRAQGVPTAILNARMSPRTFARYRRLRPLAGRVLRLVSLLAAQSEAYASCFRKLGVEAGRVHVTGSIKYDGVTLSRDGEETRTLGRLLGIEPEDVIWVAGSTQAPEEEAAVGIFLRLRASHPRLRLILVPRHPDRFEEVATLLEAAGVPFLRRSRLEGVAGHRPPVLLVDTTGELRALWGLAHLAYVGGSLDGRRGGQNMIEPAAMGAAVLFGPHVWNFRDIAAHLTSERGAIQVADAAELEQALARLLASAQLRQELGQRARQLVLQQQGATERTLDLLDTLLPASPQGRAAA